MHKNLFLHILVFAFTMTLSIKSFATGTPYLQGQLGGVYEDQCDKFKPSGRISAGYLWDLNEKFKYGLELGVGITPAQNCRMNYVDMHFTHRNVELLGVIDYSFSPSFDVFGKLGIMHARDRYTYNYYAQSNNFNYIFADYRTTTDYTHAEAAVGVGYNITKNMNLNLTYAYEFEGTDDNGYLMLGLKYSFI